jgi:uncharacterized protein (TIGR03437 family)
MLRLILLSLSAAGALTAQVSLTELNFCPTRDGRPARVNDAGFHPSHIPRGSDLVKIPLNSPDAVCNDGSPAVLYVRPAAAGARDALGPVDNKWIIHLQEGGACSNYEACLTRWCGTAYYDASKMSTRWAPPTMGGLGIFARRADNQFGNYNHVYTYYCSSDTWTGRKSASVLADPANPARSFKLEFKGSRIVDAVFDALRTGLKDTQGRDLLPPLDRATHIYLTGSSAGSSGVRHNADRVAALVKSRTPDAVFAVISDAGLNGNSSEVTGLPPGDPADPYTLRQTAAAAITASVWDALYDQSCLDANTRNPWLCSDSVFVTLNHTTAPSFNRTDLLDGNKVKDFAENTLYKSEAEFARASHDVITRFTRMRQLSPERAQITRDTGAYTPMCGIHITLDSNTFFNKQVTQSGTRYSFYDTLWNWVASTGGPTVVMTAKPPLTPAETPFDRECTAGGGGSNPAPALVTVSSASYDQANPVAPASIAAVFGANLAPELQAASSTPLPTNLLGTTVRLQDAAGARRQARLIAVSPTQINFLVPAGLAPGPATIAVQNGGDELTLSPVELAAVAPGLYSANARGEGVAAAVYIRVFPAGDRASGLIFDPASLAPVPLDLASGDLYLTLYGTGFRAARAATAQVGGVPVPVLGFAAQPEFAGLDQINLGPLPASLAGRANAPIVLSFDGKSTNTVTVSFR